MKYDTKPNFMHWAEVPPNYHYVYLSNVWLIPNKKEVYVYIYIYVHVYIICFFMIPGRYFWIWQISENWVPYHIDTCIKLNGLIKSLPSWVHSLKRTAQFAPENRAIRPKRNFISTPTIDFHGLLIPNTFHAQVKLDHLCRLRVKM